MLSFGVLNTTTSPLFGFFFKILPLINGKDKGNECLLYPYLYWDTNIKSPIKSVGIIEPEGIVNGWKKNVLINKAIKPADTIILKASRLLSLVKIIYKTKRSNKIIHLNLGTGIGTTVLELVKAFERANRVRIPIEFANRRKGDCSKVIAANSLATSSLNWFPKRCLDEMCKDGWKWQCSNPSGYI